MRGQLENLTPLPGIPEGGKEIPRQKLWVHIWADWEERPKALGDKPHSCKHCHKRFALACNLRAHLKTHEGEHNEKCTQCGKVFPTNAKKLTHGYCQPCYQNSNGIALTKKFSSPGDENDHEMSKSPILDSPTDHSLVKRERSPPAQSAVSSTSPPPAPVLLGMLDQVMMRYREVGGILPPSLSALRFLEGMPVLSQRN